MLTLRGVFKDGQVTFIEEVPFTDQHQVLVTFLDADDEIFVIPKQEKDPALTSRELEILGLTQRGMRSKEIASTLGISNGVVRNCLSNIYTKLNVRNRVEAIKKAVALGLLKSSEFLNQ
jgi:DNA-binding NarL/FixJ family response regulator